MSALARLEREGALTDSAMTGALERLDLLAESWNEIQPVAAVRSAARRLLRVHALRAADALQLAAAVVAAEGQPASLAIVTLDERLAAAARREGFMLEAAFTERRQTCSLRMSGARAVEGREIGDKGTEV